MTLTIYSDFKYHSPNVIFFIAVWTSAGDLIMRMIIAFHFDEKYMHLVSVRMYLTGNRKSVFWRAVSVHIIDINAFTLRAVRQFFLGSIVINKYCK